MERESGINEHLAINNLRDRLDTEICQREVGKVNRGCCRHRTRRHSAEPSGSCCLSGRGLQFGKLLFDGLGRRIDVLLHSNLTDTIELGGCRHDLFIRGFISDDHCGRTCARVEVVTEHNLSIDGFNVVAEQERGLWNTAGLESGKPGNRCEKHEKRDDPRCSGLLAHDGSDTLPQASNSFESWQRVGIDRGDLLLAELRQEWPERTSAKEHEQGWEERHCCQERKGNTERCNRAESLV